MARYAIVITKIADVLPAILILLSLAEWAAAQEAAYYEALDKADPLPALRPAKEAQPVVLPRAG